MLRAVRTGGACRGGVVMCAGGPVSWHSKTQKCVTLSTTQAEYEAISDMGKEIFFSRQVCPVVVYVAEGQDAVNCHV